MKKEQTKIPNSKIIEVIAKLGIGMIEGIKFTGDFKVKEKIQQDVFEALSRIDGTRTKEELRNILSQINYQEYEYRRPVFSGTANQ